MENLYFYDENGKRSKPITIDELVNLVQEGKITLDTRLETDDGHVGTAGEISGLFLDTPRDMLP